MTVLIAVSAVLRKFSMVSVARYSRIRSRAVSIKRMECQLEDAEPTDCKSRLESTRPRQHLFDPCHAPDEHLWSVLVKAASFQIGSKSQALMIHGPLIDPSVVAGRPYVASLEPLSGAAIAPSAFVPSCDAD